MIRYWFLHHGAIILIFSGGFLAAIAAFVSERRASGQRVLRRKGVWPLLILLGTLVAASGALWAGYGQDRLFDYLSGGDSYGFVAPVPPTGNSIPLIFALEGRSTTPLYDVTMDVIDVTKLEAEWPKRGLPSAKEGQLSIEQWDHHWRLQRDTRTSLNLGNITPHSARFVCELPVPPSDVKDQRYDFAIWARNGFFSERLLMHRTGVSDWVWAWRV